MAKQIIYAGKKWNCKKAKNRNIVTCTPAKKASVHYVHRRGHKGHKTRRGLAQDQRMKSSESWEKSYRKR